MAKTLQRSAPTSSVANLLDPAVGAQALGKLEVTSHPSTRTTTSVFESTHPMPPRHATSTFTLEPTGEIPNIPRQFTLTSATDRTLKKMIDTFADATGLELHLSEMLRAILHAAATALPEMHRHAVQIGNLKRPKNERGREAQREAVERRIAAAFVAAIRSSPDSL